MEPPRKKLKMDLGSSGRMTLCQLPTEVLLIIFGFLTNPKDLLNLSHTTKKFGRILAPSRVEWLFGDVLKLLLAHEKAKGYCFFWLKQWKELNQFRLVCKWWKRSVNRVLEQDQSHLSVDWDDDSIIQYQHLNAPCPVTLAIYKGDENGFVADRINTFTNYFVEQRKGNLAYNPIPSRHLHIMFEGEVPRNKWEEFSKQLLKYLEAFGRHIWYLTVSKTFIWGSYERDAVLIYSFLSQWTKLMPNIKSLVFDFNKNDNVEAQLAAFPHLKHLVSCQFGRNCNTADHVFENNTHVRKLSLADNAIQPSLMALRFTNQLEVTLLDLSINKMLSIRRVSRKINKLNLSCVGTLWSFERFLRWFTKFGKGLQYLDLDLSGVDVRDLISDTLDLPNVKYFRVKFREGNQYGEERVIIRTVDLESLLAGLSSLEYFVLEMEDIEHVQIQSEDEESEEETEEEDYSEEESEEEENSEEESEKEENLGAKISSKEDLKGPGAETDAIGDKEGDSVDKGLSKDGSDEGLTGVYSKKKKMEFMDRFYRQEFWNYFPNLHTVKIKTIWNHWEHPRYVLERPEMPKLTFKMFHTSDY